MQRNFDALEKFLDDDLGAGRAEGFAHHDFVHGFFRFSLIPANQNTFAEREAIGFHHALAAERSAKSFRRRHVRKCSRRRRRDAVFLHELLRENLGRFELRGLLVHAPNFPTVLLKQIHDAQRERVVRADHGEINFIFLRECEQFRQIFGADIDALNRRRIFPEPFLRDAGVARCAENFFRM